MARRTRIGLKAVEKPVHFRDLHATLLYQMGLDNGRIVKSGDKSLALELEAKGYDWLVRERRRDAAVRRGVHDFRQQWRRGGPAWLRAAPPPAIERFAELGFPTHAERGLALHQCRADRRIGVQPVARHRAA